MEIQIKVTDNIASVVSRPKHITAGTIGLPVVFTFDSAWDGLDRIAVFQAGYVRKHMTLVDDATAVPVEVVSTPGPRLNIGVYGVNEDGSVAIPTIWAHAGNIREGATPGDSAGYDPASAKVYWDKAMLAADEAEGYARSAEADAGVADNAAKRAEEAAKKAEESVPHVEVVQTTGKSETAVMSQKAVTDIVAPLSVGSLNVIFHSDYALSKDGNTFTPSGVLYKTTPSIPCMAGDVFGYIGRADYAFAAAQFYNASGTYKGCVQTTAGVKPSEELEIVIPAGVAYVLFCSYGTRSTIEDIPLKVWKKDKSKQDNLLYGKKITVNGDSICYGAGSTGGYAKIIGENNNMTVQNIGVGGGTIAAETYSGDTAKHWISRTIGNMDADADFAILEGGVNDASIGVPMGEMSSGYNGAFDDTTFIGAFESMLYQLVTRFAGKKYGYIAVHQMTANYRVGNDESTSYYYAAKKCCEKWGVPFLDLNVSVPPFAFFNESNEGLNALKTTYTHNGDGWHPNEEGYRKYYVPKIEAWLKTL